MVDLLTGTEGEGETTQVLRERVEEGAQEGETDGGSHSPALAMAQPAGPGHTVRGVM